MQRDHHQARQQAELSSAEAKALNPANMQGEGMCETGSHLDAVAFQGAELAKQGKCELCKGALHHGPWTDEQIAEAVADTGEPDFSDWCDNCFVKNVTYGDAAYAAKLLGRSVQVSIGAGLRSLLAGGLA